ncbi:MAG: hypothetical protein LBQ66_04850 [Planctomycetaceae bacterium]|nr:hypothetical protein [Planctomycetaceae bacterium]
MRLIVTLSLSSEQSAIFKPFAVEVRGLALLVVCGLVLLVCMGLCAAAFNLILANAM